METVCGMEENKEKLEAGSKLEPHLAQNCKVRVDWNGGLAWNQGDPDL